MAATKVTDIIVPEVFNPYVIQRTAELSAFFQSGVVGNVAELDLVGARGGKQINMPFFSDLTGSDEVLSDSSPLTVSNITSGQDVAVLHARGRAWGVNDLAKAISGADPMAAIGGYWARRFQDILISTLKGSFLAASMSGNVHDISAVTGAGGVISASTTIDAMQNLGDARGNIAAIAMHSDVVAKLAKDDLITFVRDSEGRPAVDTYLGKRVIEDDGLPVSGGVYTSYLFGDSAVGYAEGNPAVSTEVDRDSLQGDDILINRRYLILHPRGIKWQGTPAGAAPTNSELEVGTNWARMYDNKNIRIVQFKHKIA